MEQLKKCPFCGGEARLEQVPGATWDKFVVTCKSSKCCAYYIGYCDEGLYDTRTKAIEAWNTRKPIERIVERLEEEKGFEVFVFSVSSRNCGNSYKIGYETGINEAIEIVKEEM